MAYKLVVSFNNNEEVMVWPSVPPDFGPEVEQRNGTYEGISGDFNTLGPMGLRSIPLSSFFPVGRRYPFMPPEAGDGPGGSMWRSSSGDRSGASPSG